MGEGGRGAAGGWSPQPQPCALSPHFQSTTGSGFDTGSPLTSQVNPASSREQYMGAGQQTTPRDGGPLLTPGSARFSFILFNCFLKPQRDTQLLVKRSDLTPKRVQHGAGLPAGRHLEPHCPASRGGGCSPPLPEPSRRSPEAPIGRVGCGPGAQGPAVAPRGGKAVRAQALLRPALARPPPSPRQGLT